MAGPLVKGLIAGAAVLAAGAAVAVVGGVLGHFAIVGEFAQYMMIGFGVAGGLVGGAAVGVTTICCTRRRNKFIRLPEEDGLYRSTATPSAGAGHRDEGLGGKAAYAPLYHRDPPAAAPTAAATVDGSTYTVSL